MVSHLQGLGEPMNAATDQLIEWCLFVFTLLFFIVGVGALVLVVALILASVGYGLVFLWVERRERGKGKGSIPGQQEAK